MARQPLGAILPIDHHLSTRPDVTLADLARAPLVLGSMAERDFFRQFVPDVFAQPGGQPQVKYEASRAMVTLGLLSKGLGVSVCSQAIARFQPRTIMTETILNCPSRVETLMVWTRSDKDTTPINFVAVARQLVQQGSF